MSFFSDLVGGFTGSSQRKDIANANTQAQGYLTSGLNNALGYYGQASDMYSPYVQQGQAANKLYNDAIGANGTAAYQTAMSNYAGSDPFRDANADYANNALMRQYNARGMGNSGTSSLAVARAQTERGATDWNNYLNRLQGAGQQGLQATSAQSALTQGMGDLYSGYGQQQAGNAINYGNALAGSRNILTNNLMGLAGTAVRAFGGSGNSGSVNKLTN